MRRCEAWDVGPRGSAAAHKWLSPDLVLTECLIAEPDAVRLAEPFVLLTGDEAAVNALQRRAPLHRAEVEAGLFLNRVFRFSRPRRPTIPTNGRPTRHPS